jgi:transketolase
LEATDLLSTQGISSTVIDMHTVKPLDDETLIAAAQRTGAVVTAEEHLLSGGLASRCAQALALHAPTPMESVGLRDTYAESGTPAELMEKYGLTARHIAAAAEAVLKRKK